MLMRTAVVGVIISLVAFQFARAAELPPAEPVLREAMEKPAEWWKSAEGKKLADNIVTWQNPEGGWWKTYDPKIPRPADLVRPGPTGGDDWESASTFDNSATYTEIRLLARAYAATKDDKYKQAFDRGLKFVFDAQYPSGGWPQRFPLQDNYGRHITFNDKLMSSILTLLSEIAAGKDEFAFVDDATRKRAKESFDRGVECIVTMQIRNPA